jgi:hypothetical protein
MFFVIVVLKPKKNLPLLFGRSSSLPYSFWFSPHSFPGFDGEKVEWK